MSVQDVTRLLSEMQEGDQQALDRLVALVYSELKAIAHNHMRHERGDHTLNTTALVHEAYIKMTGSPPDVDWEGRRHFFAVASRAMRQVLLNYAERRGAQKRGGGNEVEVFDEATFIPELDADELQDLYGALDRLAQIDERQARIVECRYLIGLSIRETANVLGVSDATVNRDWTVARLWLKREMEEMSKPHDGPSQGP
jgi:RNA polymerase sigma factor (TIGR02999 family)